MSERDEYMPTMNIDQAAPSKVCERCREATGRVFYVRRVAPLHAAGTTRREILCARCRP